MRTTIIVDPERARSWILDLALRLAGAGHRVHVRRGEARPLPGSVERLLKLERRVHDIPFAASEHIDFSTLKSRATPEEGSPDYVIDLSGTAELPRAARTLRVLYDGQQDEAELFSILFSRRMPVVEIADGETGEILARGLPAGDEAPSIHEAADAVYARLISLLMTAMAGKSAPLAPIVRERAPSTAGHLLISRLNSLAAASAKAVYRSLCYSPHWQIGWRFVDSADVVDTHRLGPGPWRRLPGPGSHFYADPFPIVWQGRTFLFFEDFDHATGKGVISMTEFGDGGPLGPARVVLEEPWHLSYPHLIAKDGEVWMIPESSADRAVHLYRADPFPYVWRREATLLTDITGSDATVVHHGGQYWMFLATREGGGSHSDTLSLFHAKSLEGPWQPFEGNPVLIDRRQARSAGNLVKRNGKLWRPVQDCASSYGAALGLAEVVRLDEGGYEQVVRTVLRPGAEWPGRKLHTLNRAGRLECIDGSALRLKTDLVKRKFRPADGMRILAAAR